MKSLLKNFLIFFIVLLVISGIFSLFNNKEVDIKEITSNELAQEIIDQKVKEIIVEENKLNIVLNTDENQFSFKEEGQSLSELLNNYNIPSETLMKVSIKVKNLKNKNFLLTVILPFIVPLLLLLGLLFFFTRKMQGAGMQAMKFGESKAKNINSKDKKKKTTFKDVAGIEEAKEELYEIVDFLKKPKKYIALGAKIPKGVLLIGPPGCGKTLVARAVAGEGNVPFFHISGSEFVEMFVGVGASVSGDTPILIDKQGETNLLSIKKFVDQFYEKNQEGYMPTKGVKTLGFQKKKTAFRGVKENSKKQFFNGSVWQEIKGVYRHKVNKIYEIHYLGGVIKTTGDHSIFIRDKNFIRAKKVSEIKEGEILVNIPFKVRSAFIPKIGTTHKIRSHQFLQMSVEEEISVWNKNNEIEKTIKDYAFALRNQGKICQHEIAEQIGVSQMTISNWQRNIYQPSYFQLSSRWEEKQIPQKVKITPELMKLLGYYTAEGRRTLYMLQFIFGSHEKELHQDCINLMRKIFKVNPHLEYTKDNSLRISYFGKMFGDFFEKYCGNGSKNKHIPGFLWKMPKEFFLSYLKGYADGDGYITKSNKLSITSVSQQIIKELTWLCAMHGIKAGVKRYEQKGGRIIKNKPLPALESWTLIIGKTSNPFITKSKFPCQIKKPYIKKISVKPYNGYVYDLCGCKNEAFFGGEKPVLLHNSRVRDLFRKAKKNLPAILFIDELDAVGRQRGTGVGGSHDEREQTLNQILVELDGFEPNIGLIVIAATNRPDILDPALLRPGRFDRKVVLNLPDIKQREAILKIHIKNKPLKTNVNLRNIAERTPGFSGADLESLLNEAAILAAKNNKRKIDNLDIINSIEKVLLGPERKSHILTKKEKEIVAYHEAGHALISYYLPGCDQVQKISIISRGQAAGYTLRMPKEEKSLRSKSEFMNDIAVLLGGYVSEEIKFKEITTGAANDLKRATYLANKLATEYGMSKILGPRTFGEIHEMVFLGREISEKRNFSEKTALLIDQEISKFINSCYEKAKNVLIKNNKKLEKIAKLLLEKETLEKNEFAQAMKR